ncbi:FMN reductase (NADH) NtaB [Rhodobacteraceae bacterium THAF1]|uniref:flavin reductase family protein n=1 Tax=Palleronia sp. THAF1 TaxID=2587842 RepID=UPI000F3AB88F|nr:flavin reductase family protein [Palleronia sp. THAF1]QFU09379.1 FMN reductase (NADH) NtaB [Palleronia sp. THAF1]VDC22027.1 FMN reductase (NADH) NtaB [Rhodobacteraceae bacterium THAF1]
MTDLQPFTQRELRDAFSRFATGVTVVTTEAASGPLGITANSFTSVSLDPPMVLWLPAKSSRRFTPFTDCKTFAIHVMGAGQETISNGFVSEGDLFDDLDWTRADDGTPLIQDCLARFHCETHAVHDAGDHAIVVGRVLDAQHRKGDPLIFAQGRYGGFASS